MEFADNQRANRNAFTNLQGYSGCSHTGGHLMADIQVRHLSPQEFVEFEVSSREPMQIKIAYLGAVPDSDKASLAIQVRYAGDMKDSNDLPKV